MAMDCTSRNKNMKDCTCSYEPCPRKGNCCECVAYHRRSNELPGCFFPAEVERTFDRSYRRFAKVYK